MRCISLWQPYLAGVVLGDGWTIRQLGLRVRDEDFAQAFAQAIRVGYRIDVKCRLYRGYWEVRTSNKTHRYDYLRTYEPTSEAEMGAWVRGLFDSEGNAQLSKSNMSPNSWNRRVSMYSTATLTLDRAERYLNALGIITLRYTENNSATHKGTKTVYQLRVRPGRENFTKFAELVGSSIARKREALERMPLTYSDDYCSRGGKRGIATRIARRDAGGKY